MSDEQFLDAVKAGDAAEVQRRLSADPRLAGLRLPSGETPIMAALYRGHRGIVSALVAAGAPLDIFAAAALGDLDVLQRTIGADPASVHQFAYDGWTPLHLAAFFGQAEAARRLLDAGARLDVESSNSTRNTPLHAALAGNHQDIGILFIERGAPVAAKDAGGHTPLHIAAEAGSLEAVKALLARGADAHAVDAEDKTPMSRAAARNHDAVIDALNLGK